MTEKGRVSGSRPFIKHEPRGPDDDQPYRLHIPDGDETSWHACRMNRETMDALVMEAKVEGLKGGVDGPVGSPLVHEAFD